MRVSNEINDWYVTLKTLSEQKEKRREIYNIAYEYCKKNYNGEYEKEILEKALSDYEIVNNVDFIKRYRSLLNINDEMIKSKTEPSKSLTDKMLNFSGLIKNKKSYKVRCDKEELKTLGILFASYGTPKGHVIIRIKEKNEILRDISLDMDDFIRDNWTYIDFDPICNSLNKIFIIELEFFYEKESVLMGVFENTENRTFKYKLLNKLKYPAKGLDVLYVDCK